MKRRTYTKIVYKGNYIALVPLQLIDVEDDWSSYPSLEDAYTLDEVREALKRGDIEAAQRGEVFRLTRVSGKIFLEH